MGQSSLSNGRCLVLGGRGFIGSHLVDALLARGIRTRVLARRGSDSLPRYGCGHELLDVAKGDFNNEFDLLNAMDDCDTCVHLVSSTLPKTSNDNMIYDIQTNLTGTVRLLHYARKIGMKKVVFLSSGGAVYGEAQYLPIHEEHPARPKTSYGVTKLAAEKYLDIFADGTVSTVALRLSNPFGPRQRTDINQGAVAVFVERALSGAEISIWGDGEVVRDYIYISDCVEAIIKALHYDGPQRLFNIGSGVGRSLNDIIRSIETVLNRPVRVSYGNGRSIDPGRNVLSIERARAHLGWRPSVSFEDGLARTIDWFSEQSAPRTGALAMQSGESYAYPAYS